MEGVIWAELTILAPSENAEAVAAYVALSGGGVEIRDEGTLLRPGRLGRVELLAHVPPDRAEAEVAALMSRFSGLEIAVRLRREDEWRDVWKQFFKPRRVGRHFVIKPSWEPLAAEPDDLVLEIDPGRAFGTGGHESTRLVLEALESLPAPTSLLDVGTGSGILALAAARRWPTLQGLAIDVDADAVACAAENLARNGIQDRVRASGRALADVPGAFDLVLANLTAETLLELAPSLSARVAPSGRAILSGILAHHAQVVADVFGDRGLALHERLDEGEWSALVLGRGRAA